MMPHRINPLASPSAGAPALKYGDVNTVTPSPGEVKGLIIKFCFKIKFKQYIIKHYLFVLHLRLAIFILK